MLIGHVMTAMVSIASTLGIVLWTQPVGLPTGIVTIDATEAVLAFIKSGGRDMPDADYETEALKYQADLEAAIETFARDHSVIVVNAAAVLAGAPDITDRVSAEALAKASDHGVQP
ncbi:TrbI F-type domain-containing protein [Paenirhodobacter populi]|uniref:Conjugal transfer protein n=1 Tax=Paenirhodobacter populi TaxID=2306993 RepID=A0A443JR18_9RHOB|nr:TrbI F-type domain-containing protein [Sinirhodobacter populi]RWR22955.1 conjugal transfer protein [Sinirhodobacter populi]